MELFTRSRSRLPCCLSSTHPKPNYRSCDTPPRGGRSTKTTPNGEFKIPFQCRILFSRATTYTGHFLGFSSVPVQWHLQPSAIGSRLAFEASYTIIIQHAQGTPLNCYNNEIVAAVHAQMSFAPKVVVAVAHSYAGTEKRQRSGGGSRLLLAAFSDNTLSRPDIIPQGIIPQDGANAKNKTPDRVENILRTFRETKHMMFSLSNQALRRTQATRTPDRVENIPRTFRETKHMIFSLELSTAANSGTLQHSARKLILAGRGGCLITKIIPFHGPPHICTHKA